MLWSPSCSASLSERFAPLKAKSRRRQEVWRVVYQRQNSEIYTWKKTKKKNKTLTSSGAHWCPQTCSCWGTSPASASWRHDSFRQERPSGCCRWRNQTIKMFNLRSQGESQCGVSAFGRISAFTLNKHHWTVRCESVIIWAQRLKHQFLFFYLDVIWSCFCLDLYPWVNSVLYSLLYIL